MSVSDFDELLAILDLNQLDDNTFIGSHPEPNPIRTFGGQMIAQSFVAGSRTVPEKLPPSAISAHFIAGGDPEKDLEFHVVRLRDERRFANRRVDVMQDGSAAHHSDDVLPVRRSRHRAQHQTARAARPRVGAARSDELLRGYEDVVPHFVNALRPIDWRYTNDPTWVMRDKGERLTHNRVWMKAEGTMPDDQVLHAAALVYASDTTVLDSIITTHGLSWGFDRIFAVTMNHSVWLHRPVHFDDWVLYSTSSPVAADSRGLGTGHFFDRTGQLLATVVQQGIVKHFPGIKR